MTPELIIITCVLWWACSLPSYLALRGIFRRAPCTWTKKDRIIAIAISLVVPPVGIVAAGWVWLITADYGNEPASW